MIGIHLLLADPVIDQLHHQDAVLWTKSARRRSTLLVDLLNGRAFPLNMIVDVTVDDRRLEPPMVVLIVSADRVEDH